MNIKDSVAIITGGANGIGESVAKYLAAQGAKVIIGDNDEKNGDRVKNEISDLGGECTFVVYNSKDEQDTGNLIKTAVDMYGKLNIMVPCSGIIRDSMLVKIDKSTGTVIKKMSLDKWQEVIDVNLTGTFLAVRDASEAMINTTSEGIIFIISSINKNGQSGQLNYSSSKVANALMPKILIGEFLKQDIRNIRVVGIAPGFVATPMLTQMDQQTLNEHILPDVHLGRLIAPEEIADLISYVCTNEAINATTIEITGGLCYSDGIAK